MNLELTTDQQAFRTKFREWLREHQPAGPLPDDLDSRQAALRDWWRSLYRDGWLGLSVPRQYGGQGMTVVEEVILADEIADADAPPPPMFGYILRPILRFGSEEQRRTYLPPLLACDTLWCQGFSEPGAGSDLAGLRTAAVADGDGYRISGQKVWTSWAKYADYCLVLARTDQDAPKHDGISAFVVELRSPGVSVRPLKAINEDEEFAEVFFDEVRVPASAMLGGPGDGWKLAMVTTAYERGSLDTGYYAKFRQQLAALQRQVAASGIEPGPQQRRAVAAAGVALEVLRLNALWLLSSRLRDDRAAGVEMSIEKMLMTRAEQTLGRACLDVLGASTLLTGDRWFRDYLFSRAASIYGGSAQIQRDIIATRILGLPR